MKDTPVTINEITNLQSDCLTSLMQDEINAGRANGTALYILKDGKELYRKNFGYADKDAGIPIRDNTIYRMYSMSKPILCTAIMLLIERGLLSPEDPAGIYIPEFNRSVVLSPDGSTTPAKNIITIQHLLNMTAGIYYPEDWTVCGKLTAKVGDRFLEAFQTDHPLNTYDMAKLFAQVPLGFEPGSHWNYGVCADILGAIIEIVTGRKLSEFLSKEIFDPLGMTDTGFYVPSEKLSRYSKMYDRHPDGSLFEHEVHLVGLVNRELINPFESGGAGIVSTADDYARFASMLACGGVLDGVQILKPDTMKFMLTSTLPPCAKKDLTWDSLHGYTYGNLFRILISPKEAGYHGTIGEFGWDGWTGNYFYCDPYNHLVFLYIVQICGGTNPPLMRALSRVLYGSDNDSQ
jgi:CubicO group peptidase (beta-lactamase class C family)